MSVSVLSQVVLPLCLAIIMFGMGLSLTVSDFGRVFKYPKAVIIGLIGQLLFLPVIGFTVAYFMVEGMALAVGIMLLAACPGGTTSNLITQLARGDLALSISLTGVSSLLSILTIPIIMSAALVMFSGQNDPIQFDITQTILTLLIVSLLPIVFGMLVRIKKTSFALKLERKVKRFSSFFLVVLVIGIAIEQREVLVKALLDSGPAAMALNVTSMLIGLVMARIGRLDRPQTTSIAIEVGVQNSALAMLIATSVLGDSVIAIPAAVYSLVMYFSGGIVIAVCARQRRKQAHIKAQSDPVTY